MKSFAMASWMNTLFLFVLLVLHHGLSGILQKSKNNPQNTKSHKNRKFTEVEVQAVLDGYKQAYELCQYNFKLEQWNCPKPDAVKNAKSPISFTSVYPEANKETSYIYSIIAAGVAHHVLRACLSGKDEKCRCGKNPKKGSVTDTDCIEKNIEYGFKRTRRILRHFDYKRVHDPTRKFFNWKNAAVGINVYQDNRPKECHCRGISGHCSIQSCWISTPPSLKLPAMRLKQLYNQAIKIKTPYTRTRPTRTASNMNDTKLVYINDSPNYCEKNKKNGITGTLNRECDGSKDDSCTKLCSDCGFRVHSYFREVENRRCNCKFHWCCQVTCETCKERKVISKCLLPA